MYTYIPFKASYCSPATNNWVIIKTFTKPGVTDGGAGRATEYCVPISTAKQVGVPATRKGLGWQYFLELRLCFAYFPVKPWHLYFRNCPIS